MTKEEFQKDIDNFSNHRILLWEALKTIRESKDFGLPILELGCGYGSTPYLQKYADDEKIQLFSFDNNKEWSDKFGAYYVEDWSKMHGDIFSRQYSVVLIDEAPGEHRALSLKAVNAKIIVIHDSEPAGWNSSDYKVRPLFDRFKYKIDIKSEYKGGAWATALSNTYNVSLWKEDHGRI